MFYNMMRFGTESANGDFNGRYFYYHPMMGWAGSNPAVLWIYGLLCFVTWLLIVAALVALIRWLWKKGDKAR